MWLLLFIWMTTLSAAVSVERLFVCPGETVAYVCESEATLIRWKISCHASTFQMLCQSGDDLTLERDMIEVRGTTLCNGNVDARFVSIPGGANLNLTIHDTPTIRHIEISCESTCRYLFIAGTPSPPENFTSTPNYSSATDGNITVVLTWSSPTGEIDGMDIEYTLLLTASSNYSPITHTTHATNWTTSLQFNQTHHVTLYSTTCGGAFSSDNFTTNITIKELPSSCPPPVLPAGVELTTIVNGSVIAYQCGEGLVPEGRAEALCGADGIWRPPPANFTCSEVTTSNEGNAVSSGASTEPSDNINPVGTPLADDDATSPDVDANEGVAVSLPVSVSVTAVVALLVGLSAGLTLGVVIGWIARSRKQPSTGTPDVPPAGGESEVAGLAPVYEEIGLQETQDIHLKENAAYGYKTQK